MAGFLRKVYDGFDTSNDIEPTAWREALRSINEATVNGLSQSSFTSHEDDFLHAIRHSNEVFSAFKVHDMGQQMAARLIGDDGQLKPFSKWVEDVQGIASHHVGSWLRTEYNTAVNRAHNAADWKRFERDRDIYPNLRWMPTQSPDPEGSHQRYWEQKLTLPVEHPFWDRHHPGDRWNCKCSLEQTDEPATPELIDGLPDERPQRGLENNMGKDGHTFSQNHPYFPENCNQCAFYKPGIKNRLVGIFSNRKKDCYNCPYINKALPNGFKEDSVLKDRLLISNQADPNDLESNIKAARSLLGTFPEMKIKIRPHVVAQGVRNPEFEVNGILADNKMINCEKGITSAFQKAIKQGCSIVVIDLDARLKRLDVFELSKYMDRRKADVERGIIKETYVIYNGKAVKIIPYKQNRFEIQNTLKQLEP